MIQSDNILRVDASPRGKQSVSRDLADRIIDRLNPANVVTRDVAGGLPPLSQAWIDANFTPAEDRSAEQRLELARSDGLVAELEAADTIVISLPIWNFGIPSMLKAWVDLVARVGLTFQYTESGPVGLLDGKRAILAVTSGGTKTGSEVDYATAYLRHVLGFMGIQEVEIVAADAMAVNPKEAMSKAEAGIGALAA
jgi:FMN-dependent NADH-azoreductase